VVLTDRTADIRLVRGSYHGNTNDLDCAYRLPSFPPSVLSRPSPLGATGMVRRHSPSISRARERSLAVGAKRPVSQVDAIC
jgi:hypothetical protein